MMIMMSLKEKSLYLWMCVHFRFEIHVLHTNRRSLLLLNAHVVFTSIRLVEICALSSHLCRVHRLERRAYIFPLCLTKKLQRTTPTDSYTPKHT